MESLQLKNQLCFPIYALSRLITTLYRPHLEKLGLTYPQYLVLLVLWENEEICVRDIGELLWLDSGTLTPLLKRMEENGFIKRFRSTQDERHMLIRLSEQGNKMKEKARIIPQTLKTELKIEEEELYAHQKEFCKLLSIVSAKSKNRSKKTRESK